MAALCERVQCGPILTPYILGSALSCFGFALVCALSVRYFSLFTEERFRWQRLQVAAVLALSTTQTIADVSRVNKIFAEHYGDILYFNKPRIEDGLSPIFGALLQAQAQLYLVTRAYRLSKYLFADARLPPRLLRGLMAALAVFAVFFSTLTMILASAEILKIGNLARMMREDSQITSAFHWLLPAHLFTASIIDVVLATAICGQLYATRHRVNGRPRNAMTDNRLTSFSRLMMSSSVFAGAIQLSVIGVWYSYITSTTSSWLYLPLFVLPKIYSCSFLVAITMPRTGVRPPSYALVTNGNLVNSEYRVDINPGSTRSMAPWTISSVPNTPSLPEPPKPSLAHSLGNLRSPISRLSPIAEYSPPVSPTLPISVQLCVDGEMVEFTPDDPRDVTRYSNKTAFFTADDQVSPASIDSYRFPPSPDSDGDCDVEKVEVRSVRTFGHQHDELGREMGSRWSSDGSSLRTFSTRRPSEATTSYNPFRRPSDAWSRRPSDGVSRRPSDAEVRRPSAADAHTSFIDMRRSSMPPLPDLRRPSDPEALPMPRQPSFSAFGGGREVMQQQPDSLPFALSS